MQTLHATRALLPDGWRSDVRLALNGGRIAAVAPGVPPAPGDARLGVLLPALPNLHGHAFQRGMAGLTEVRGTAADSFWTWRETMYRFALAMTPAQMEAVAAQAYVEMLEAGFCRVGEFHYLHHDRDGRPYADPAEMAVRIAAAAQATGIGLTLLPVFYAHGGFGGRPPTEGQRRFVTDLDGFARLLDGCDRAIAGLEGAVLGVAPHSLRAVTGAELSVVAALRPGAPVHVHVAEQTAEVEDCLAATGRRPVEWLLDEAGPDARWCLVHATHVTEGEVARLAATGAVAGLCPVTEANLGDGIVPADRLVAAGGRFGVGTDSNVSIGAAEELRQLEYSQRLARRARNVLATAGGSTGRALFDGARAGGAQALGTSAAGIAMGAPADLVGLDADHPALVGRRDDALLDAWIFAAGSAAVDAVWVAGRQVVSGGWHRDRDAVAARYRRAVAAMDA